MTSICSNKANKNEIKWPGEVTCFPSMGTCIDNSCVCKNGYNHDLTFVRFRNCSRPDYLMLILYILLLLLIPRAFYIAYKQYSASRSTAKIILITNLVTAIIFLIFILLQIGYDYHMNGVSLIFFLMFSISFTLVITLQLYSLIAPLYAVARKSSESVIRSLAALFIFFKIAQSIPLLIAVGLYEDYKNENNDDGWNTMLEISAFIMGAESFIMSLWVLVNGTRLITLVKDLSKNNQTHGDGSDSSKRSTYLNKVETVVAQTKKGMGSVVLVITLFPTIYFTTKYLPFNYVFFYTSIAAIPLGVLKSLEYVSKSDVEYRTSTIHTSQGKQSSNTITKNVFPKQIVAVTSMQDATFGKDNVTDSSFVNPTTVE